MFEKVPYPSDISCWFLGAHVAWVSTFMGESIALYRGGPLNELNSSASHIEQMHGK